MPPQQLAPRKLLSHSLLAALQSPLAQLVQGLRQVHLRSSELWLLMQCLRQLPCQGKR